MSVPELPVGRVRRFAGVTGALYFIATVSATALIVSTGTTEQQMEQAAVESFLPAVAATAGIATASMFGYVVSLLLLVAFAIALHRLLRRETAVGVAGPVAVGFGATLFIVESLLTVGIILELAPAYVGTSGAEQATVGTVAASLLVFRSFSALAAGALVSVGAVLYGFALRRTEVAPRWLGSVAVLLGVLGLVGALWPLVPTLSYLRQVAYFLFTAWALVVGILLLRS